MSSSDLYVVRIEDQPRQLGRQVVHDPMSRLFPFKAERPLEAQALKRDFTHRVYQPRPVPDQPVGCCTGVDLAVKCDTVGNRRKGVVLDMDDALRVYSRATEIDPWPGSWRPNDTGSSGLAAAKAAKEFGLIERYEWIFTGAAGVLAALQTKPVGVGTWWTEEMFYPSPLTGLVYPSGRKVGGHQWTVIGYRKYLDAFVGQCWWGPWGLNNTGRFLIRFDDLGALLADDGDAHVVYRSVG